MNFGSVFKTCLLLFCVCFILNAHAGEKVNQYREKFEAYQEKRDGLVDQMLDRHKLFYGSYLDYFKADKKFREQMHNDMYTSYTDIHVPPGELFTEKVLVARHSRLCLGEVAGKRVAFHGCNVNTGGLLWESKSVWFDPVKKHLVPRGGVGVFERSVTEKYGQVMTGRRYAYSESDPSITRHVKFHYKMLKYSQLLHNNSCLTAPFGLNKTLTSMREKVENSIEASETAYVSRNEFFTGEGVFDTVKAQNEYWKKLQSLASKRPIETKAHLVLEACKNDGSGQLWQISKTANNGYQIRERESGFCLRPETIKAQVKSEPKNVLAVFYPCIGEAHEIFEIFPPTAKMPVWYDHNGVIKSDNGFCMDVPENRETISSTGSLVYLATCTNDQTDRWDYSVEYDKTVKITNDYTGFCLYPYDQDEGVIPSAKNNSLVQRPCNANYGQGWNLRIIDKKSPYFQLEAIDKNNVNTGKCMDALLSDSEIAKAMQRGGRNAKVTINMSDCKNNKRGRWQFGHWKGLYEWTLWNEQNSGEDADSLNELSKIYWVDEISLKNKNVNGVCRLTSGVSSKTDKYQKILGTWNGKRGTCSFVSEEGEVTVFNPGTESRLDSRLEILTGMATAGPQRAATWIKGDKITYDQYGESKHPPTPRYFPFLAGGNSRDPALYLCRQLNRSDKNFYYGYQADNKNCVTISNKNMVSEFLVFKNLNVR